MQSLHDPAHSANTDLTIPPSLDRRNEPAADTDEILLGKINRAVASLIVEELAVKRAQEGAWSKSKEVGRLLIEAKKRHPKVADFKAFLSRVSGLKLSRAYDLIRIAGGDKNIEEELREQTRERVQRHRAKKKQSKPAPASVTHSDVTESKCKAGSSPRPEPAAPRATGSAEFTEEQRRGQMAQLDEPAEEIVDEVDKRINCVTNTIRRHIDGLTHSDADRFFEALRDRIDDIEREVWRATDDGARA